MKYIIIAILFFNPILAESQKRKNKEVVKETKSSPSVLIDCYTVSPVFFLEEGASMEERNDAQKAYDDLIELDFNGFPHMLAYLSKVEEAQLKENISKWMAKSQAMTIDYDYGIQNEGSMVLRDITMHQQKGSFEDNVFLTEQFGTSMKTVLTISSDTTDIPELWYSDNRLYRKTTVRVNPEPIGFDDFGYPLYNPEDLDDFGEPFWELVDIYNSRESELDFSIVEFCERIQLLSSGRLLKKVEGLSFSVDGGPDYTNNFIAPIFIKGSSDENGKLFKKDLMSTMLIDNQASTLSVYTLEKIIVELLKFAKKGTYEIYEASYDDEMNIAVLEHSISSGTISALPSDQLFNSDDEGRKFLQTVFLYDSVPMPIDVDGFGMPVYDPKDVDAYGNPIVHLGKDVHNLSVIDIAGIQLLEDWYLNEETGELSKRIKGFTLLSYIMGADGETVHGVGHELGRRFYFRMKTN